MLTNIISKLCGHCKNLAPAYEKVAMAFKMDKDVVVASLETDKHKDLAEKYGVSGYPTLKFFPTNNKAGEDYHGGRDLDNFVKFINEKCGTSRDGKGQLTSKAGIVAALDNLVKEFVSATDDEKKAIFARMEEEAEKLNGDSTSEIQFALPRAAWIKGADYVKNEIQQLERMLARVNLNFSCLLLIVFIT
ncbi:unnamed protein product [Ilex paraguariensis]|uniref:protein disulfide-isomerase n=1 Tax=Ilex paraguariensis TaxID=185542 RepID=A0ABC8SLG1_9AQUA